jgi:hypothetical protein
MYFLRFLIGLLSFIHLDCFAQATYQQAQDASLVIGRWISRSTSHFDFLSATPIGPKRAGTKFFIVGAPAKQTASDYGFSQQQNSINDEVKQAYDILGINSSGLGENLIINRYHLGFNFANLHDFTLSFIHSSEDISGWGLGYKKVLAQTGPFYTSYRIQYARSRLFNYFDSISISQDLSISLYLRLIDFYAGVKHSAGKILFESDIPTLQLPEAEFGSRLEQIETFYGIVIATSVNSRLSLQVNQFDSDYSIAAKFSFRFDSLFPTANNWLRDPRYLKQ